MLPGKLDLVIPKSETWKLTVQWLDSDGSAVDLTSGSTGANWEVAITIRSAGINNTLVSSGSLSSVPIATGDIDLTVTAASGIMNFVWPYSDTALVDVPEAAYTIVVLMGTEKVVLLEGDVTFTGIT